MTLKDALGMKKSTKVSITPAIKSAAKDIRTYVDKGLTVKVANVILREENEKTILNEIKVVWTISNTKTISPAGFIYFIVSNNEIIKYGYTRGGLEKCMKFYGNLTKTDGKGRYVPNFYVRDELKNGKFIEIYIEILPSPLTRSGIDIETGEPFQKTDVSIAPSRENDWKSHFKKCGYSPVLNRQETGARKKDFSQKYAQEYKDKGI